MTLKLFRKCTKYLVFHLIAISLCLHIFCFSLHCRINYFIDVYEMIALSCDLDNFDYLKESKLPCWHFEQNFVEVKKDYLTTRTSLSPMRRGFEPGFVHYKKGALDSQPQAIKFTSCFPMVGDSLRLLLPPKLVTMI